MKPLTEIVAELERRTGGIRTRSMEKTVNVNEIELCRLLAAFRAGEEMRAAIFNSDFPAFEHAEAKYIAIVRGDGE